MNEKAQTAIEPVKIASLEIEGFKRVSAVSLSLQPNGLTVIGGDNMAGKSSILDGIASTLGGERFSPSDPIQHGKKRSKTKIALSNGIDVESVFTPSGRRLVVSAPGINDASGQTLLNRFISSFALDLGDFLTASERERSKILLKTIGVDLTPFEVKYAELYAKRLDIGRQRDRAKGHYESLPFHADVPAEEESVADLAKQIDEALQANRMIDDLADDKADAQQQVQNADEFFATLASGDFGAVSQVTEAVSRVGYLQETEQSIRARIVDLEKQLAQERERLATTTDAIANAQTRVEGEKRAALDLATTAAATARERLNTATAAVDAAPAKVDIEPLRTRVTQAETTNKKVRANKDRAVAHQVYKGHESEYSEITTQVDDNQNAMRDLLDGAKMPIKGLTVDMEGLIIFRGQRWDCMSGAEQLIVATAVCRAVKPEMGFVLIDNAERMDVENLRLFGEWLERENIQGITVRVSKGPECTLIIEDGMIAVGALK